MKTFNQKKLSYFGQSYEKKVIREIIGTKTPKGQKFRRETSFGRKILRKLNKTHFDNNLAKELTYYIQKIYNKSNIIPWFDTIETVLKTSVKEQSQLDLLLEYLKEVENIDCDVSSYIQESCTNFINTKNLFNACQKVQNYISEGRYDEYKTIVQEMQDALVEITDEDELQAFVAGDHSDLNEGERHVIPTGIKPLDIDMNGGLALGELALIIAALKVGKTSFASFIANNAAMLGYNVLQIFFEDTPEQVKLKHRAKFTGLNLGAVSKKRNKRTVASKSDTKLKKIKANDGCLVLHKMDSTESTVESIGEVITKAKERGIWFSDDQEFKKIKFDVVLIDYVDCITSRKKYDSDWGGDKEILRDLEKLASKKHGLGFACWAFTQGGRSSLNTNLVTVEDMGGSIKKAQIAHFIASIAKTLEQRSSGHATFAILGSRLGRDGIIYEDCTFDNANMQIELSKESKISEIRTEDAY